MTRYRTALAAAALFAIAGCSKVHYQGSFTVRTGEAHTVGVSAPLSDQTIQVAITSDEPVGVWVLLDKHLPEGKDVFDPETLKEGLLAKEKDVKESTITATVPAKEKFTVYVTNFTGQKAASVSVKIDSK